MLSVTVCMIYEHTNPHHNFSDTTFSLHKGDCMLTKIPKTVIFFDYKLIV